MSVVGRAAQRAVRVAPTSVVGPVVRRRGRRQARDPRVLETARDEMEFLVGVARPDVDLDALALRHLERRAVRAELRWREDAVTRQAVSGVENLEAARGGQGGLILGFAHHGHFDGAFGSLRRAGAPAMTMVGHPLMLADDAPGHLRQHLKVCSRGGTVVSSALGYRGIRDLVSSGHVVALALDQPGTAPARLFGRDLLAASGAARMAFETRSPVVVLTTCPTSRLLPRLEVGAPLVPADFGTWEELHAAALAPVEAALLAWPEGADWPRSKWTLLDDGGNPLPPTRGYGQPEV